jgi:hypothetical protein
MTEFIRKSTASTVLWWPVIVRGGLYMLIATLTSALSEMDGMSAEQLAGMHWIDWLKSALTVMIVGLTTLRTFIDSSVSQHADKLSNENSPVVTFGSGGAGAP